jgi:hypothetical protein
MQHVKKATLMQVNVFAALMAPDSCMHGPAWASTFLDETSSYIQARTSQQTYNSKMEHTL